MLFCIVFLCPYHLYCAFCIVFYEFVFFFFFLGIELVGLFSVFCFSLGVFASSLLVSLSCVVVGCRVRVGVPVRFWGRVWARVGVRRIGVGLG
jgi:hypothetical protein